MVSHGRNQRIPPMIFALLFSVKGSYNFLFTHSVQKAVLGTGPRYSLVVDEDFKKLKKYTKQNVQKESEIINGID